MTFLRNAWYAAGWADEVAASLLRRRIVDIPILLFRRENGCSGGKSFPSLERANIEARVFSVTRGPR